MIPAIINGKQITERAMLPPTDGDNTMATNATSVIVFVIMNIPIS